jgi:hypothetical protein
MNARRYTLGASGNPIVQGLTLLVVGAAVIGAVLMGAVLLAIVLALGVIAAMVIAARVWWLRRKLGARGGASGSAPSTADPRLIDAEYTVLEERETRETRERRDRDKRP